MWNWARLRDSSARLALATLAACLLSACRSTMDEFPSARDIPELRACAESGAEVPRRVTRFRVRTLTGSNGTAVPVDIAVEERGLRDTDRMIVFLHGVLTNRGMWEFVSGALADEWDQALIDLPGCGESSKPDPALVGDESYGPDSLARFVCLALEDLLERRERPPRVTLVAHSLGGLVALRLLGSPELRERFGPVLDAIDGAVLIAPTDIAIEKKIPAFERIAKLSEFEAAIAATFGLFRETVAGGLQDDAPDPGRVPREPAERVATALRQRCSGPPSR
ncbi:MAG: alpha/beta fold hydrolase [Planctomycetota bacterium]|jgi:pimeloyl-ACP methyl ester carboxylesterase